jgi:hypothetical protein
MDPEVLRIDARQAFCEVRRLKFMVFEYIYSKMQNIPAKLLIRETAWPY